MKKTIYLTILSIVTVFCIIIGSIMHLGLFRLNLNPFRILNRSIISTESDIAKEIAEDITKEITNETKKEIADAMRDAKDDISSIDIDCDTMDLTIQSGKKFDVSYDCSNDDLEPFISMQDGKLTITQTSSGLHLFGGHSKGHHFTNNVKCSLTVTIPKSTKLQDLHIQLDLGNLELEDISADSCDIYVNVGNIELESFICAFLTISGDMGNVECKNCDIQDAQIDCDVGNVTYEAKNSLSDCDMTLSTDAGRVTAFGEKHGQDYSHSGHHGSIKITSDIGDITIK